MLAAPLGFTAGTKFLSPLSALTAVGAFLITPLGFADALAAMLSTVAFTFEADIAANAFGDPFNCITGISDSLPH
jgi:hypothetical protein